MKSNRCRPIDTVSTNPTRRIPTADAGCAPHETARQPGLVAESLKQLAAQCAVDVDGPAPFASRLHDWLPTANRYVSIVPSDIATPIVRPVADQCKHFRMLDWNRAAIGQMDVKWLKWPGLMQFPNLLDRHGNFQAVATVSRTQRSRSSVN